MAQTRIQDPGPRVTRAAPRVTADLAPDLANAPAAATHRVGGP